MADPFVNFWTEYVRPMPGSEAHGIGFAPLKGDGVPLRSVEDVAAFVRSAFDARLDAFMTVSRFPGTTRKGSQSDGARLVALDLDCDPEEGFAAPDGCVDAVLRLPLPAPSYFVNSGNGVHVYWFLDTMISPVQYRAVGKALKRIIGEAEPRLLVDTTSWGDVARVLRAPGTFNMKDPDNPRACAVDDRSPEGTHPALTFINLITQDDLTTATMEAVDMPGTIPGRSAVDVVKHCAVIRDITEQVRKGLRLPYGDWIVPLTQFARFKDGPEVAEALMPSGPNETVTAGQKVAQFRAEANPPHPTGCKSARETGARADPERYADADAVRADLCAGCPFDGEGCMGATHAIAAATPDADGAYPASAALAEPLTAFPDPEGSTPLTLPAPVSAAPEPFAGALRLYDPKAPLDPGWLDSLNVSLRSEACETWAIRKAKAEDRPVAGRVELVDHNGTTYTHTRLMSAIMAPLFLYRWNGRSYTGFRLLRRGFALETVLLPSNAADVSGDRRLIAQLSGLALDPQPDGGGAALLSRWFRAAVKSVSRVIYPRPEHAQFGFFSETGGLRHSCVFGTPTAVITPDAVLPHGAPEDAAVWNGATGQPSDDLVAQKAWVSVAVAQPNPILPLLVAMMFGSLVFPGGSLGRVRPIMALHGPPATGKTSAVELLRAITHPPGTHGVSGSSTIRYLRDMMQRSGPLVALMDEPHKLLIGDKTPRGIADKARIVQEAIMDLATVGDRGALGAGEGGGGVRKRTCDPGSGPIVFAANLSPREMASADAVNRVTDAVVSRVIELYTDRSDPLVRDPANPTPEGADAALQALCRASEASGQQAMLVALARWCLTNPRRMAQVAADAVAAMNVSIPSREETRAVRPAMACAVAGCALMDEVFGMKVDETRIRRVLTDHAKGLDSAHGGHPRRVKPGAIPNGASSIGERVQWLLAQLSQHLAQVNEENRDPGETLMTSTCRASDAKAVLRVNGDRRALVAPCEILNVMSRKCQAVEPGALLDVAAGSGHKVTPDFIAPFRGIVWQDGMSRADTPQPCLVIEWDEKPAEPDQ